MDTTVDVLIDVFASAGIGAVSVVDALFGAGVNVWLISVPASFEKLLIVGPKALCCWPITACDCPALQASKPSYHVCSLSVLSVAPHFPYQEPPRAQQLRLSLFLMTPQVRHAVMVGDVVAPKI